MSTIIFIISCHKEEKRKNRKKMKKNCTNNHV